MNRVNLIGRTTKDIELKKVNDKSVALFTIAVNRSYKNKDGKYDADFINCVAFGNADNIAKYCPKGSQIAVDGRLQTRTYDAQDGSKRYVSEIICNRVEFLGSKQSSAETQQNSAEENTVAEKDQFEQFAEENQDVLNELPF